MSLKKEMLELYEEAWAALEKAPDFKGKGAVEAVVQIFGEDWAGQNLSDDEEEEEE